MKALISAVVSLVIICAVCATGLVYTYNHTAPKIEQNRGDKAQQLCSEIMPNAKSFKQLNVERSGVLLAFRAEPEGFVVATATQGYGGELSVMVGIDGDGKIVDSSVLSMKETSGIGTRVLEPEFKNQFKGVSDLNEVDTITGATISSKAYKAAVELALATAKELNNKR